MTVTQLPTFKGWTIDTMSLEYEGDLFFYPVPKKGGN